MTTAIELTDADKGADVTIGHVTGTLAELLPTSDRVHVVLIVGGCRAIFQLDHDAPVEVRAKEPAP